MKLTQMLLLELLLLMLLVLRTVFTVLIVSREAAAEASEANAEAGQAAAAVKGSGNALRKRNVRKKGRPPLKKRKDDGHDEVKEDG